MNPAVQSELRGGIIPAGDCRSTLDELLGLLDGPAWRADALCREYSKLNWFHESGRSAQDTKAICAACLVRAECRSYALARPTLLGIRGGLTTRERRKDKITPDDLDELPATA